MSIKNVERELGLSKGSHGEKEKGEGRLSNPGDLHIIISSTYVILVSKSHHEYLTWELRYRDLPEHRAHTRLSPKG